MPRLWVVEEEFLLSIHTGAVDLDKACLIPCFALFASVHYIIAGYFILEQFLHARQAKTSYVGLRCFSSGRCQFINENPFRCRVVGYARWRPQPTGHLHKLCRKMCCYAVGKKNISMLVVSYQDPIKENTLNIGKKTVTVVCRTYE